MHWEPKPPRGVSTSVGVGFGDQEKGTDTFFEKYWGNQHIVWFRIAESSKLVGPTENDGSRVRRFCLHRSQVSLCSPCNHAISLAALGCHPCFQSRVANWHEIFVEFVWQGVGIWRA